MIWEKECYNGHVPGKCKHDCPKCHEPFYHGSPASDERTWTVLYCGPGQRKGACHQDHHYKDAVIENVWRDDGQEHFVIRCPYCGYRRSLPVEPPALPTAPTTPSTT